MKKIWIILFVAAALCLTACTKEEEADLEEETGTVDKITTEMADTAVKKVKTPINKARLTQGLGNERTDAIDKAMQNQ